MPILCQLVALAAVALIGAIDVGAFLAAAPGLTLIHICGDTVSIMVDPPSPYIGLGWLTSILVWTDIPFSHPLVRVRPSKEHSKGRSSGPRTKSRQSLMLPCWGHTTAEADGSRVTWVQHRPRVDTT